MIAACPKCAARYRIEREKIGDAGVRLRCSRCESVFRVRAPAPTPLPVEPVPQPVAAPAPAAEPPQPQQPAPIRPAPTASAAPPEPAKISVLVAVPDVELAKQTAQLVSDHGAPSLAVFDGVDAMMEIQRRVPKAVVLAADLPKMFGFQICEVLKRNESLQGIHVVLAGAVHHPDRYKREPTELYGADEYVETPDLPEGLLPLLRRWDLIESEPETPSASGDPFASVDGDLDLDVGASAPASAPSPAASPAPPSAAAPGAPSDLFELGPPGADPQGASDPVGAMNLGMSFEFEDPAASPSPEPRAVPAPRPAPVPKPAPVAAAPAPEAPVPAAAPAPTAAPAPAPAPAAAPPPVVNNEARASAERLARIIVSDIVLYNEEKFAAAIGNGDVETAMSAELDEGRGLFAQRVDAELRAQTDFLAEELVRVARARGMK